MYAIDYVVHVITVSWLFTKVLFWVTCVGQNYDETNWENLFVNYNNTVHEFYTSISMQISIKKGALRKANNNE